MQNVSRLLSIALKRAGTEGRNHTGFRLACQLRDSGLMQMESEAVMLDYANQIGGSGAEPYTKGEALATLRSAFSKPARAKGTKGDTINGKACQPVNTPLKHIQKGLTTSKVSVSTGINLMAIAEAKHLPVDFLESLGISDFKYSGLPSVKIPYYAEDGMERAIRFRLALTAEEGTRFKWRKGDHALPYGLNRLEYIRKAGWVLIVEGESDCWTCWFYGIPAIGAPGKSVWPLVWGEYVKGLEIYVWQEPGAQDFTLRVLASALDLRFIKAPDGIKDINHAHIQGLEVPVWLEELKTKAEYGEVLKVQYKNERLRRLYHEAKAVIEAEDPLELVEVAIRELGYGGDLTPPQITYLAMTSRTLEVRDGAMLVHLLLSGQSSSGKSYTLVVVLKLLPSEAYQVIDAGSPRALIYNDAPLEHRALIFGEADSLPAGEDNPAASAVRNLLQDHYLHYEVTIRDKETGNYVVKRIHKPGPTVMITTSTRSLGAQLSTRLFTLEIPDSKEQITAALETQAQIEMVGVKAVDPGLVAFQHYLQLKAPWRVVVPFAVELAAAMAKTASAPRILRDFQRILSLIKAVTILRHYKRQSDTEGRIVAKIADYETVRELVADMYVDSSTGATSDIRTLVEAVIELDASRKGGEQITNTALAKRLGIGIKQAERWAKRGMKFGWLVNREQRKSYPADYVPGEPIAEIEGLPILVEQVDTIDTVSTKTEAVNGFSFKKGGGDMLTPLTDGDIHSPTIDPREAVLDIPVTEAIEMWRVAGEPIIQLTMGEKCFDLAKLLSRPDVPENHLEAVKAYLEKLKPGCGQ